MPLTELVRRRNDCGLTFRRLKQLRVYKLQERLRTKLRHLSCSYCCSAFQGCNLQGSMATEKVLALKLKKGNKKNYKNMVFDAIFRL
jgi:hypothetical protein